MVDALRPEIEAKAGPDLDRLDPSVFVEIGFEDNILVRDRARGLDRHRLCELEHGVWLTDEPTPGKRMGLGRVDHRCREATDRVVQPDDAVRHPLRPVHGL